MINSQKIAAARLELAIPKATRLKLVVYAFHHAAIKNLKIATEGFEPITVQFLKLVSPAVGLSGL